MSLPARREAALARLLERCFEERRPVPGSELCAVPLSLLRDAIQHQSEMALRLAVACRLPTPER
jgi:hypothetical protein